MLRRIRYSNIVTLDKLDNIEKSKNRGQKSTIETRRVII